MNLLKKLWGLATGGNALAYAAAAAGVVLIAYIGWLRWSVDSLEARNAVINSQLLESNRVANHNAQVAKQIKEDGERSAALVQDAHRKALAASERRRIIEKEIVRVPAAENCVLGPALRDVIDGVWGDEADRPGRPGREDSADRTVRVPARSNPPSRP